MNRTFAIIVILSLFLAGCTSPQPPAQPAFIISGQNSGEYFPASAVHIIDLADFRTVKTISMPRTRLSSPAIDHEGRLWIGLAGSFDHLDNRVRIIDQTGTVIDTIEVGNTPEAGISFAGGYAFIACRNRGFSGTIWVVDEIDLTVVDTIELGRGEYEYSMLTASAASEHHLVVSAQRSPPRTDRAPTGVDDHPYSEVLVIDVETKQIVSRTDLGPATAIWDVIALEDGTFLLINNAGFRSNLARIPINDPGDIIHFDPHSGEVIGRYDVGGFPMVADVDESTDTVFTYCRIWSSILIDEQRALASYDLSSHQSKREQLPDNFCAVDVAVHDSSIYFAGWVLGSSDEDGLYLWENGELKLVINIRDASAIVIP